MTMFHLLTPAIAACENGRIPDSAVRFGIRRLLASRRRDLLAGGCEAQQRRRMEFIEECRTSPIAVRPEAANEQHYEVPPALFQHALGPRMKYSCCWWPEGTDNLADAEVAALNATCERANLQDGQSILDLGCGWGSLSLWMAEQYPRCEITAVSNSHQQREHIEQQAHAASLANLNVRTADVNDFAPTATFDRIVSVEMFEHVRNHPAMLSRIRRWLNPGGQLFVHIFCHRAVPYFFESAGESDWMANHFFTGGVMPSDDLLLHDQAGLSLVHQWRWSGQHYQRTCNEWLVNLDRQRGSLMPLLDDTYGEDGSIWFARWRIFFMACAELFGWQDGDEWWVSHYLFKK